MHTPSDTSDENPVAVQDENADDQATQPDETATEEAPTVSLAEYEQATSERDEYRGDLQRLAAEFDNFRKRAQREKTAAGEAANDKLLGEMLAVLDDFERALDQSKDETGVMADGIRMVHARLLNVLTQHGLTEVDTTVPFDANLHDAVLMQPAEGDAQEGDILQVAQKGYQLGDRVLRHPKVIVAGPPADE